MVLNILLVTKMIKKVRSLCFMLPKMSAYRKKKWMKQNMTFLIKYNESLEKYN